MKTFHVICRAPHGAGVWEEDVQAEDPKSAKKTAAAHAREKGILATEFVAVEKSS